MKESAGMNGKVVINRLKKSALASVWREFFHHLPAWFYFYNAFVVLYASLAWMNPSAYTLAWPVVFPLFIGYLYYAIRIQQDKRIENKRFWFALLAILVTVTALGIYGRAKPQMLGPTWESHINTVKIAYEISNVAWVVLIIAHCGWRLGRAGLAKFFGAAFLYGMLLESGGIDMGFFSEEGYHLYVPVLAAPVATMFGWATVFYPALTIFDKFAERFKWLGTGPIAVRAAIVSLIAICFDIHLDPVAIRLGLWTWNEAFQAGTTIFFLGDPIINFFSWFFAVFTFAAAYEYVKDRRSWSERRKVATLFLGIPAIQASAAIGLFGTMALIEGLDGPTITILVERLSQLF